MSELALWTPSRIFILHPKAQSAIATFRDIFSAGRSWSSRSTYLASNPMTISWETFHRQPPQLTASRLAEVAFFRPLDSPLSGPFPPSTLTAQNDFDGD